jgi:hypothetical protein
MKLVDLFEMPKIISQLSGLDDLTDISVNAFYYKQLSKLLSKVQIKFFSEERKVYSAENKFFCLDDDSKKVLYYMQYDTSFSLKLGGSFLWQSLVWRSKSVPQMNTLPHEIFFNELLPKYKTVATDGQQTEDGQRFWEYQIDFALKNKFNVYYFNTNSLILVELNTLLDFEKALLQYDIYGSSSEHKNKLLVISKKELNNEY